MDECNHPPALRGIATTVARLKKRTAENRSHSSCKVRLTQDNVAHFDFGKRNIFAPPRAAESYVLLHLRIAIFVARKLREYPLMDLYSYAFN